MTFRPVKITEGDRRLAAWCGESECYVGQRRQSDAGCQHRPWSRPTPSICELQKLNGWGLCLLDHARRACVILCCWRVYAGDMRYPDGGGLSAEGRARREKLRLQAAQMFEQDVEPVQVARCCGSAPSRRTSGGGAGGRAARRRWRPRARAGRGAGWMRRSWPGCGPRWTWARRRTAGGEDQRWTLARVAALIARLFHVRYTLRGASYLLHRIGFSPQVPGAPGRGARRGGDRRLAGRDLGEGTRLAAATGAWICFEDEAGQNLRPPKARTWGRRGRTPVVTVSGKGSGRVSVAGLVCLQARRAGAPVLPDRGSTAGVRASAARCPKPTTPGWSPPRTTSCMPRSS